MKRQGVPVFAIALHALLSPSAGIRLEDEKYQYPIGGEHGGSDASQASLPFSSEKLESYIHEVMDRWKAPGMAVAIVHGNKTWAKGFGYASLPSTPVTPHTLFYTGSTTKSFTAAALSLLIDNSSSSDSDAGTPKLSWTTPISQLLRDDFATAHVALQDAASHRTGSAPHDLAFVKTSRDQVRRLRYLPLAAEPRQRFQYNNHMFTTLGHLVETLTSTWLGTFFRDRLWAPMGMDETFLSRGDPRFKEAGSRLVLAEGYYWRNRSSDGHGEYVKRPYVPADWDTGAGAIISNVLDYAKYLRVMMREQGPISAAGHRELRTPRTFLDTRGGPPFTGPVTYTLGWMHGVFEGVETWHHTGTVNEFVTSMMMMPSREMGIVVIRRRQEKQGRKLVHDGRKRLYPHVPNPPLPPSASLDRHAGCYYDPGYGEFIVDLVCDGGDGGGSSGSHNQESGPWAGKGDDECHLEAHLADTSIFKFVFMLEHVSGDYWVGWAHVKGITDPDEPLTAVRAQFRLNERGEVSEVGVDLRLDEDDQVPLVWLTRVD
ncbi:penicillin-binding protein [Apiospora aurea]|uniref:Penicillin-binding protein n=1 Tax=Apiospora aurea TaxID=335848 RepID=A0ABR1QQ28_9PEZI